MQEEDNVPLWQYQSRPKYDRCRCRSHRLPDAVETSSRHNKSTHHRKQGQNVDTQPHAYPTSVPVQESHQCGFYWLPWFRWSPLLLCRVFDEVRVVHGSYVSRIIGFVLFDVCGIDPFEGEKESVADSD